MSFTIRPHRRRVPVTYNTRPFLKLPLVYCSGLALLTTLLVLSSGAVYAEWVKVGETDDGMTVYTVYYDPATIRRNRNLVTMWQFYDYKTVQTVAGIGFLTVKEQWEFDCAEERRRVLALTEFSGNMGSGTVVYSNSEVGKWQPVAPSSMAQLLWKFACKK